MELLPTVIREPHPLAGGDPPSWASGWGEDEHAPWASITVEGATMWLRWIPPGRFLMGTPEWELGRRHDEGPQHEVIIERGFWIFSTPCTQQLWEAVMGANPSRFRSPTRPVESVSWHDCQQFVERLNGRLDRLTLSLPSEAQWEYACRTRNDHLAYSGSSIEVESSMEILDAVAWFAENSHVDFELPEGHILFHGRVGHYPRVNCGTHPVGRKLPNSWGLFDMLGNVSEWCADAYLRYGGAEITALMERVSRGGSWATKAAGVRPASRGSQVPENRDSTCGFRCAEFREGAVVPGSLGDAHLQRARRRGEKS